MHDFLSPRRQKLMPTRIFLANSFLSNISLDGTHRDTKYRALAELYKKDPHRSSCSEESLVKEKDDEVFQQLSIHQEPTTSSSKTKSRIRVDRCKSIDRSNSVRSNRSRESLSSSASSATLGSVSCTSPEPEEIEEDFVFPVRESKGRLRRLYSKSEKQTSSNDKIPLRKIKTRRRRKSSESASRASQSELRIREKVSRTISGSSADSHKGHPILLRSSSISPGFTSTVANQPHSPTDGNVESHEEFGREMEYSTIDLLGMQGEILDSHRGFVTERKQFGFAGSGAPSWPLVQTSFISKYRVDQLEDGIEKEDSRTKLRPRSSPAVTAIQKWSTRLTRISSGSSIGSGRSRLESPIGSLTSSRIPWSFGGKSKRVADSPSHMPMRPRRLSAVHSIHIETEAGALENLLGIKLSDDPDDELSYENLLIPLAWTIDYLGDLSEEEAKNLLRFGDISGGAKMFGPVHVSSYEENHHSLFVKHSRMRHPSSSQETCSRSQLEKHKDRPWFLSVHSDPYRPGVLDDPEWETAIRRQKLYLESYFSSIISNELDADHKKKSLNELFKNKYPNIQLTFSKFRSLKRDILKACTENQVKLDLAVVAFAYLYFEKLVLRGFINKPNRKILASVCIVLAAKMNDLSKEEQGDLFDSIQSQLRVNRSEVNAFEFAAMVALGFDLHVPIRYVRYHYDILAKSQERLPSMYAAPMPQIHQPTSKRLGLNLLPIREMNLPGFGQIGSHRVNARTARKV